MADHKICDACETVEHCAQFGCIPLQSLTRVDRLPAPRQAASVDLVKAAAHDMLVALRWIDALVSRDEGCDGSDLDAISQKARAAINLATGKPA